MCDNTPPADPHYLNHSNHSWPLDRLGVYLISGQEYFTFLYGHTKHNIHTQEGERKENKQTRTWISSKPKKGEVYDTFVQFSVHLQAIASVYSHKVTRNADPSSQIGQRDLWSPHPSSRLLSPVDCLILSTSLFCPLLCSVHFSVLSPSLFCPLCSAPFSVLPPSLFCPLLCSAPFSVLPPSLDYRLPTLLLSTSLFCRLVCFASFSALLTSFMGNFALKPFVSASR